MDFVHRPVERPDPGHYLRKREGSPGGLKPQPKASPQRGGVGEGGEGLIAAVRGCGSPKGQRPSPGRSSVFYKMYERGDLPVRVDQARPGKNGLRWTVDLATIDLHYYLPIFVEGLLETQEPYAMLARRGVEELVAGVRPTRLLPVIPQLVMGLRAALKSPRTDVVQAGLRAVNLLVASSEETGQALVPYYRQLLPALARHVGESANIGDAIDYGQAAHRGGLGALVLETLHALERRGGPDAYLHIKYHVATYESCLLPSRLARKP